MWFVIESVSCAIARREKAFRKDESGSLVIFTLFILVLVLMLAGIAIDSMRHETNRVAMQNTLDNAILAASSLSQDLDAEILIKDHVAKAGLDPDSVTVTAVDENANGNDLVSRRVMATSSVQTDTMLMNMMGIDTLESPSGGAAEEAIMNIEISLIVDISGSMGWNSKMDNLKVAATDFVNHVLTTGPNASRTSISIIPYNATVVTGSELLSRLNADGEIISVTLPVGAHPGAISAYSTEHNDSTCVRVEDGDFNSTEISATTPLTRYAHFDRGRDNYNSPDMWERWCDDTRSEIMVLETDPVALADHIDDLSAGGWTGIDNGMKWGVALLDPAIAPVIEGMVDDGVLAEEVRGRPGAYDGLKTKKIVVLMTDGANTIQRDLKDEFKYGPTRIWHAESRTTGFDAVLGRDLTHYDGYYVEMPDNDPSERWYVPGSPWTTSDDYYTADVDIPADALQRDYLELNRRFAARDIASFFFENSDSTAFAEHDDTVIQTEGYGSIDDRLEDICDAAKYDEKIEVFAIGFEAPSAGLAAMENCASKAGNYFDVSGTEISAAFDAIAGQITLLRLTN